MREIAQEFAIGLLLQARPFQPGYAQLWVRRTHLNQQGMTIFFVEQNAYHALRLAHRGYVMVNGRITMSGTGADLLARPEIRAAYLEGGRH